MVQAAYGSESLFDATRSAYTTIFDRAHRRQAARHPGRLVHGRRDDLHPRLQYFASYGGGDDLGTKAAMVGWLLSEAEKAATLSTYAASPPTTPI